MTVATSTRIGQRSTLHNDLRIALPPADLLLTQDEEWCVVRLNGEWREIRLHDYDELFSVPGLYERFGSSLRPGWPLVTHRQARCERLISVPATAWLAKSSRTWVSSS
jgi:hypothetical protein